MSTEHEVVTPPQPEKGFQPARNSHGYELTTIGDELRRGTTIPVVIFEAYVRATGEKIILDDRTFDGTLHSRDPVDVKAVA